MAGKKKIKFTPGFQREEVQVDLADRERDPVGHARPVVAKGEGNLYQSTLFANPTLHAPTLDIDHPCHLVESTTPGHYHLYIDVSMPWEKYVKLLNVLKECGIVDYGYAELSIARGASHLRKPDVPKSPNDYPDS